MDERKKAERPVGDLRHHGVRNVKTGFEEITHEWNSEQTFERIQDTLKDLQIDLKESFVLELGSGTGALLKEFKKHGVDAVGIDSNPRARFRVKEIVKGRIEEMQFDDETFDVVASVALLDEEVYGPQDTAAMESEILRVLKPGGVYIELGSWGALPGNELEIISTGMFETVYRKP